MLLEKYEQEVIETARQMLRCGLVTATWGNVSVRPGTEEILVITPSGMDYAGLGHADMVALDFSGRVLKGERKPSSEYRLHCKIYRERPDVLAIVHTHSVFASAFAAARTPIPVITEELAQINGGPVKVADYHLPGTPELAQSCTRALGSRSAVLLANHGLVGTAPTLAEALKVCQIVEKTAQITLYAKGLGAFQELSAKDTARIRDYYLKAYGQRGGGP